MEYYKNKQYNELEGEIFKDISECEGKYQVSNYGRVRSLIRKIILTQVYTENRYLMSMLYIDDKHKNCYVHRLVAQAFLSNDNNLPEINHKDENKKNNHVENLEWCTKSYNNRYGNRINKVVEKSAITIVQLDVEGNYIKTWKNISDVGRQFEISGAAITGCCNGTYKTACGYKWMYKSDYDQFKKLNPIKYKFKNKPFVQLSLKGEYIREWYSLMEMHEELGYGISCISNCLNKRVSTSNGYDWVYLSEYYDNFNDLDKEYSNTIGHQRLMKIASTRKIM